MTHKVHTNSNNNNTTSITIPIERLVHIRPELDVRHDSRHRDKDIDELVTSIEKHGVLEPIIVRQYDIDDSKYEICDGNRRFLACKKLGLVEIPAIIKGVEDKHVAKLSLATDIRKNFSESQRARAVAGIYAAAGFPLETVISNLTRMQHKKYHRYNGPIDEAFLQVCKEVGYAAVTQVRLLYLLRLDSEILDKIEQRKIPTETKIVLANSDFRKRPRAIQEAILEHIMPFKHDSARTRRQLNMDLQTLEKAKDSEVILARWRETPLEDRSDKLRLAQDANLAIERLIALVTGKKLRCSLAFKKRHIDSKESRDNMLAMVKAMGDTRGLTGFDKNLTALSHLVRALQHIIDDATATYERQEDILKP